MQFEERTALALEAIRPRKESFLSAIAVTTEKIRGLLVGTGETGEDRSVALGEFARGHVDAERFSRFTHQSIQIGSEAQTPVRAAQKGLADLVQIGDRLFVLELARGADLGAQVGQRLATIGSAFAAAHVVDLARRGEFDEEKHGHLLNELAYADWSHAERALAPGLVIELDGADFVPAQVAPYLDAGMKLVFVVNGDVPAAAMSRLITPGIYVEQAIGASALETFAAYEGTAAAALLPDGAVEFVHDPSAGETTFERFTSLELPREIRKRAIGGISPAQQAEDLALLQVLSEVPAAGGRAEDPAGKLSAWLMSQTNLVGEG